MGFFESLWDVLGMLFWAFVFIAAVFAFVMVVTDLFRDRKMSGLAKAAWLLFLVLVPLLGALVYVITRGGNLSAKAEEAAQ